MKRRLRQKQILDLLATESELSLGEVCSRLGASEATVRREFVQLEKEGKVARAWGGVRRVNGDDSLGAPAFAVRLGSDVPGKRAVAKAAAELLKDGDVVMIDGGTTTFQLCPYVALRPLRLITNSLVIAQEVDRLKGNQRGAEVLLTGGILQPESGVVAGTAAEAFLKRYRADWAFISAAGVNESAVTNYNEAVLGSEKLMLAQSGAVALLVDRSKLGREAMSVLCPVGQLDHLITNATEEENGLLERIASQGVAVRRVRPEIT